MRKLWPTIAGSALSLIVIWLVIRPIWNPDELGGSDVWVLTVLGCVSVIAFAFAFVSFKQRGIPDAMRLLHERSPEAILHRAYGEGDFTKGISLLADRRWRPKMFAFLILLIHADGVEFWTADTTAPLVRIPAERIREATCRMAPNSQGASWPTLFLTISPIGNDERQVILPIVIMREGGMRFLASGMDVAERVRGEIQATHAGG